MNLKIKETELSYEQQMARQIEVRKHRTLIQSSELPLMDGPVPTQLPVSGYYAMEYLGYDVPEGY